MADTTRLIILGSTGSIGTQTLAVVRHLNALHEAGRHPRRYEVVGLAAANSAERLAEQADEHHVGAIALNAARPGASRRRIFTGEDAAEQLVRGVECDVVVAGIVGQAGLPATLAAIGLGRTIALANKETLVAAGELVVAACQKSGSRLLPVDSEHAGVWQALRGVIEQAPPLASAPARVTRVTLTASGGPLRTWEKERIRIATPQEALRHPTWRMGDKVTIDSASLMNKALEIIEARWLFGLSPERITAVIHPQSIVHALVEFDGGSTLAQLAGPDMRLPIQAALTWPHEGASPLPPLDWSRLRTLEFEPPDPERFPAILLGHRAIREGGTAGAVINAANEHAVHAFLNQQRLGVQIPFGRLAELAVEALEAVGVSPLRSLADVAEASREARRFVARQLAIPETIGAGGGGAAAEGR